MPEPLPASAPEDAALSVAAVARRLGVAPATLRTWDRRYGLGPSTHHAGTHRRYSPTDLERLLTMRRLSRDGVPPAEAARLALAAPAASPTEADIRDAFAEAEPIAADPAALAAAAEVFDHAAIRWQLARAHARDTLAWWEGFVRPALRALRGAIRLEQPGECAATALTAAALAELRSRTALAQDRTGEAGGNVVLLVPRPGDPPDVACHALAAALTAEGLTARIISGGGPQEIAAVADGIEAGIVLAHVAEGPAETRRAADLVAALLTNRPERPVYLLRESPEPVDRPSTAVHRVRSAAGALHEVVALSA